MSEEKVSSDAAPELAPEVDPALEQVIETVIEAAPEPPPPLFAHDAAACRSTLALLESDAKIASRLSDDAAGELLEAVCSLLTASLKQGTESTTDVLCYLQLICKLCRGEALVKSTTNSKNVVTCAAKGVCGTVSSVLTVYASHPHIAECCALLTMILASDNAENQEAFAEVGICAQLIVAMKHNIEHPKILDIILRACRNLGSNLPVAARLISDGISEQIIAVAEKYLENIEVIEAVLWLIVNLSCDSDAATILGAVGVCRLVTDILARWADNADITQGGCWAIRNLACAEACNYVVLSATPAVPLIIAALGTYRLETKVAEQALWALANVGYDQELSVKIVEGGAVPLLADIANIILTRDRDLMATPAMFSLIAMDEAFLWAVRNISSASEGNNVHFNDHAIALQCVVLLLREYGRDPKLAEAAMAAIGNLIHDNDACSVAMKTYFMVEVVAQVRITIQKQNYTCTNIMNNY
jgi:hypothetical protein